jgi:drug/metabolite transporter (DMT)-like permease
VRPLSTIVYATLALVAFAANSVLCRIALSQGAIDPATFSTVRLTSGAATLFLLTMRPQGQGVPVAHSWISAGLLALYAVPFSFAYTRLTASTGALVMFGTVQVTMLIAALRSGERPDLTQWIGLGVALAGLVYLMAPGLSAPPPAAAALMGVAGFAWGMYSLRGRHTAQSLGQNASNFVRAVPFVLVVSAVDVSHFHVEPAGVLLACASGILASGLGYVAWYAALGGLSATRAAIVQLSVPVLAAAGGVMLLGEAISARLVLSTIAILGGIALAIIGRERMRGHQ